MNSVENFINLIENNQNKYKFSPSDVELLKKAAFYADKYHAGQKRKSNEDYVTHAIAVGRLLLSWSLDVPSIAAGILHDLIEDTAVTYEDIVKEFGEEIAFLVNSVTKISIFSSENRKQDAYNEENNKYLIQVFMNMCNDIRVLFIKVADRYHNMKTIEFLAHDRQIRMAKETMEMYSALAGRIGMYSIKTELQDLCFKVLEPEEYNVIANYIEENKQKYTKKFDAFVEKVNFLLEHNNINAKVYYRIKGAYSTREKMRLNGEVIDLFAVRILTENVLDCYLVLGILHINFFYNKDSFKDFISTPKSNLYQTIHTSLLFEDVQIEVQIRTFAMDEIANFGLAAHWRYKENANSSIDEFTSSLNEELNKAEDIQEKINIIKQAGQKIPINIYDINYDKWLTVPKNTSVIDYVYLNHREQFMYFDEVYVNGSLASAYQVLEPADNIKIIFVNTPTITKSWSNITRDIHVKKYIATTLAKLTNNAPTDEKELIDLISKGKKNKIKKKFINEFLFENFHIDDISHFLKILEMAKISNNDIVNLFNNNDQGVIQTINDCLNHYVIHDFYFKPIQSYFKIVKIPKCCSKIPPMQVVGILENDTLYIHNYNCEKVSNLQHSDSANKIIVLHWDKDKIKKANRTFAATVSMQGDFTQNISTLIINTIIRYRANIKNFYLKKDKTLYKKFTIKTILYVKNLNQLEKIQDELLKNDLIKSWKLL